MLEWMQKHKKYLVVTVWISALALIFASMVEWGGGGFSAVSRDSVAKVGDIYISHQEYQQKYNEIYDSVAENMRKAGIPDDGKPIPEIGQEAFRILVQEKLMEMLAQDIGVHITPNEILDTLLKIPEFQDATHNFNREQYESLLRANHWTTGGYEAFVAKNLLQTKMQNFPIAPVSTLEANAFITAGKIQDNVALQPLNKDSALKRLHINLTDKEVRDYWEKNKSRYVEPAHYKIAYIALDMGAISIDKQFIEKFYRDNERKYNSSSFEKVKSEVEQDYRRAIVGIAGSYMANISKLVANKKAQLKPSDSIITMEPSSIALLQKHFDSDLDIQDITLRDIPLYTLQLNDDGIDHSELMLSVSGGDGLLSPLEYGENRWIIPYVLEKTQKQQLSFEQARELASKDLMIKRQNEEFKKVAYNELSSIKTDSMQAVIPMRLSLWHDSNSPAYKTMLSLGLLDVDMRSVVEHIMQSSQKEGVVFVGSDRAILFRIIDQAMPSYDELFNVTNAEDEMLQEMKIRDLRNAMLDYAMKRYKVIDYRRQD